MGDAVIPGCRLPQQLGSHREVGDIAQRDLLPVNCLAAVVARGVRSRGGGNVDDGCHLRICRDLRQIR